MLYQLICEQEEENKVRDKFNLLFNKFVQRRIAVTMFEGSKMFSSSTSLSPKNNTRQKPNPQAAGFQFPTDMQDTLFVIWQNFKTTLQPQSPPEIYEPRCRAVRLMMQCHKILKLPLQTLYLSISVLEKILITNYHSIDRCYGSSNDINILAIACLYSCQKLEKIRNYGVSYWLKHLSSEILASIGYPGIVLSAQSMKKYEAQVMHTMNYNLFSSTIFDVLLGVWTLKPPTQHEFYFCQYLLQLSLFVEFNIFKKGAFTTSNTATSTNQNTENETEQNQSNNKLYAIDIVVAILSLSYHFFPNELMCMESLIKTIWREYKMQQNYKAYEQKVKRIKIMANLIFEKVCNATNDPNCQSIVIKFSKQVNLSISNFKFQVKSDKLINTQTTERRYPLTQFQGYQSSTVYQTF